MVQMELSVEKPENIMKLYDENTGLWRFLKTDKGASKSLEIIEKILYRLGLSKNEMKIYIYVARRGEHKASEISRLYPFTEPKHTEFYVI